MRFRRPVAGEDSRSLFRQALSMIGLRLRDVRRPIDVLIIIAAVLSFVLPGVGIPFWAVANARVTRRRGEDAIRFYEQSQPLAEGAVGVTLFPEPTRRARRWMVAGVLLVGCLPRRARAPAATGPALPPASSRGARPSRVRPAVHHRLADPAAAPPYLR